MKKNAVHLGGTYTATVSGKVVRIRIDAESPYGGWDATNLGTRKTIRVKSAQRLRAEDGGTTPPAGQGNAPVAHGATEAAKPPKVYDPDRCATPRCKGEPVLTYIGKPLCQNCWDRHCADEGAQPEPNEVVNETEEHGNAGDEVAEATEAGDQEIDDMATRTKSKKGTSKKSRKVATKAPEARKTKTPASAMAPATRKAKAATNGDANPKRVSAIDAAAVILKAKGEPMRSREIIEAAASKGLWTSPSGKTPHATLDAAMRREINTKGADARFTVEGRGLFGFNAKAATA
ncbi:MAG: winged helix-turn-helix domain-containing protein [Phycisphaerae bacterium]|nr:winged helix-turn-helix domain-containing protein [Phycisphaerae bacterium]NUQ10601.1 hypothetical protein [Phycisphaerae bacterium]